MYQTLKSSFRNFEYKIKQIKELIVSEGAVSAATAKEELIQMISMIINGEDIVFTEALETDRSRKFEECL